MESLLQNAILENPVAYWLWFVGILLLGFLFKRLFSGLLSKILYRLVHHDNVPHTEFVQLLRRPLEMLWVLFILFLAFDRLHLPDTWHFSTKEVFGFRMITVKCYEMCLIWVLAWLCIRIIKFLSIVFLKRTENASSRLYDQVVPFFRDFSIVGIVIFAVFVALGRVFEVNVPALITGLGIGGLAVALAAKETLEDLFASFTIMLDAPFVINDKIKVGTIYGIVEKVGFRSTYLRMGDGSLTIIPNRQITSQALENLSQRPYRRCRFMLHLALGTPSEKVQKLVSEIQEMVEKHDKVYQADPGKTHFDSIGEDSLLLYVRYHLATHDLAAFRKYQEELNYNILQIVAKNGVSLSNPTQVTILKSEGEHFVE